MSTGAEASGIRTRRGGRSQGLPNTQPFAWIGGTSAALSGISPFHSWLAS